MEQNTTAVPNVYGKFLIGCFVIGLSFKFSDLKHRSKAKFSLLPEKSSGIFAISGKKCLGYFQLQRFIA